MGALLQQLFRSMLLTSALLSLTTAVSLTVEPTGALAAPTVLSVTNRAENEHSGTASVSNLEVPSPASLQPSYSGSVADVPNPRRWVVDDARVMSEAQRAYVDHVAQRVKETLGAEIAVVTVDQTPGWAASPKVFATSIFNARGMGDRAENNGVLVLLVKDQRRLEIEIGAGLNQPFNRASWLEEMQQREMVPLLKKNDFGGGLVAGVDALAEKLRVVKAEPLAAVATTPGLVAFHPANEEASAYLFLGLSIAWLSWSALRNQFSDWMRARQARKERARTQRAREERAREERAREERECVEARAKRVSPEADSERAFEAGKINFASDLTYVFGRLETAEALVKAAGSDVQGSPAGDLSVGKSGKPDSGSTTAKEIQDAASKIEASKKSAKKDGNKNDGKESGKATTKASGISGISGSSSGSSGTKSASSGSRRSASTSSSRSSPSNRSSYGRRCSYDYYDDYVASSYSSGSSSGGSSYGRGNSYGGSSPSGSSSSSHDSSSHSSDNDSFGGGHSDGDGGGSDF